MFFFLLLYSGECVIEAQKLDGTGRFLVFHGQDLCHSIAFDWLGNNMFWVSSSKIEAFSLKNTSLVKTLIHTSNAG